MKTICRLSQFLFCALLLIAGTVNAQDKNLKLVFIRHAERPETGNNLTCKGFNRSLQLPSVLYKKFGKPSGIYVTALNMGEETKRARMFQTITPFAVKYNLNINTAYDEGDYKHVGKALLKKKGTIIIVWEHNDIQDIVNYLGVKPSVKEWPDNDYDSIWIVTFNKGNAVFKRDKEGLNPSAACPF